MESKVYAFPTDTSESVAQRLRELAQRIEDGELGDVHSVTLVVDVGGGAVHVEFIGNAQWPPTTAHLMLHMGMLKLAVG